jgi:multiple sugar transport system permease protein/raffinose/stachyose/melibiose transport system permease protein
MKKAIQGKAAFLVFAFPGLLLYTVLVIYPLIPEIVIGFQNHNGVVSKGYVGLKNYQWVFTHPRFLISQWNTITLAVLSTLGGLPLSLVLAILLDGQGSSVRQFFKTTSFIPAVLAVTVIAQMWKGMLNNDWGLINQLLRFLGLEQFARSWLADPNFALPSVAFAFLWQYIGFNMVLFYAGIKAIPKTYFEAALIDGAGPVKSTIKITIPLLQDIIKFVLVISIMGCLGQFVHVRLMTGGGPGDRTWTVMYFFFQTAFMDHDFGRGCAVAAVFLIECVVISRLIDRLVARERIEF